MRINNQTHNCPHIKSLNFLELQYINIINYYHFIHLELFGIIQNVILYTVHFIR